MSEPAAPPTPLAGDVDVALDSFGLEAHSLAEPSTPRTGASASRFGAVPDEGIRLADAGAEFLSEEALPSRPPRQTRDEAALDAFENETSFSATSYIPSAQPPTVTAPAAAPRDQRIAFRSTWPAMAASIVLVGGTALGLWWQAAASSSPPAEASVVSTAAPRPEIRPSVPADATVSPASRSLASAVEPQHEARPPAEAAPEATRELPDPVDVDAVADVPAGSSLMAETGIGAVLPQPTPAPEIPAPAQLPPLAARGDVDDGTLPGRRTVDSPPAVSAAEPPPPSAESLVVAVLGQYQSAYSRLDAASVREIWPSVDPERLERAFRNLAWQDLEFNSCRVNVAGVTAVATCTGVAEYTTRVGNRSARDPRSWTFSLKRESDSWLIQAVQMR